MASAPDPCPANDGCKPVGSQRSRLSLLSRCDMMFLHVSRIAFMMMEITVRTDRPEKYVEAEEMKETRRINTEGKKTKTTVKKRFIWERLHPETKTYN